MIGVCCVVLRRGWFVRVRWCVCCYVRGVACCVLFVRCWLCVVLCVCVVLFVGLVGSAGVDRCPGALVVIVVLLWCVLLLRNVLL